MKQNKNHTNIGALTLSSSRSMRFVSSPPCKGKNRQNSEYNKLYCTKEALSSSRTLSFSGFLFSLAAFFSAQPFGTKDMISCLMKYKFQ